MKLFIHALILLNSLSTLAHEDWSIQNLNAESTLTKDFVAHVDQTPYLSQTLSFEKFGPYFDKVDNFSYRKLQNRGEAHITVITPPEFSDDLKKFVSIEEINQVALKMKIQESSYKPICLGRGSLQQDQKYSDTYFIVVEAQNLLNIRKEIAKLYESRGGKKFDPNHFYPHITVGYTDRDLYEADGVTKDSKVCMKTLHVSPLPSKVKGIPVPNSFYVDKNAKGGAVIRGNAPLNHQNLDIMKKFGVSRVIIFKNDKAGEVKSEINGLADLGFKKDLVQHIDFDWKDNQDFSSGCKKFVQGIALMKEAMQKNEKLFFHCTTGEDRSGALAGSYLLATKKHMSIKDVFKNEMCAKGYEGGDPDKDKEVVEKIRTGLTKTFLKTAYRIDEAKKQKHAIDESICAKDPQDEEAFVKYSTQMAFVCGETVSLKK